MGRHSPQARHFRRPPVIVACLLLAVALIGWVAIDLVWGERSDTACAPANAITVTAAPDIAPAITLVAREVSAEGCYRVSVDSRDSASTAEVLGVSDGTARPDVWIPESTVWLWRARENGAWNTAVTGSSIASSPVVLALSEDAATGLGWPAKTPAWEQLLGPAATPGLSVGFPDPARDAAGLATLFGLRELVKAAPDPGAASTAAMRVLSANLATGSHDLYAALPAGKGPVGFPTSENALLRHNEAPGGKLVAVYADVTVPSLDYPYVVLPGIAAGKRGAAERFLTRLRDQDGASTLAEAGFRTPGGEAPRAVDDHTSGRWLVPVPVPDADAVDQVLNAWAVVNLSGRVQVLIDVSGSMNEPVPGTGKSRMELTMQAAVAGVSLFKPATKISWWLFSTRLDGDRDYRMLLPMRTVREHLAGGALDTLRGVRAVPGGGTGLYDTVLAAYRDARQNWEPGRINVVTVLTDGKNDDRNGITLDQLLAELKKLQDPRRPLFMTGIGIGDGVDPAELTAITDATGGAAFTTPDPTRINEIFYASLAKMLCQPPTCTAPSGGR